MAISFVTERLAPTERFAAWNRALERNFGHFMLQFGLPAEQFHGEIETRCLEDLRFLRIRQNASSIRRPRRSPVRGEVDGYYLVLQQRGSCVARQLAEEARLEPGEMTLIDSALPATYRFDRDNLQLILYLPKRLVLERGHEGAFAVARTMSGGAVSVAARLLEAAFDQAEELSGEASASVRESLLRLLFGSMLAQASVAASAQGQMLALLREYALAHLADPKLSPAKLAAAHGISVRHVHRLFTAAGMSLGSWIRKERLQRCAADLRNTSLRIVNLTAIAHQWGFSDSAHFSRAFKSEFGQSPSRYRDQYS